MLGPFATRLSGSSDLYQPGGRHPYCSINFITSHDGFTLNDLVSYRDKHNHANGEDNRDGENNNHSDNYGVEGPSDRKQINEVRMRQIKNMLTTLLVSQGVPMIVSGDECRRTQQGNNNAYCQDNEISWFDWHLVKQNHDLVRFCQSLIEFRKKQPTVRRRTFLTGTLNGNGNLPDVSWYTAVGTAINWHSDDLTLICLLTAPPKTEEYQFIGRDVLLLLNANDTGREFVIPPIAKCKKWNLFIDTAEPSPNDIFPDWNGPAFPKNGRLTLPSKSMCVFVAEAEQVLPVQKLAKKTR